MAKKEENNIKFDFGASTQEVPVNSAESKELNDGETIEAQTNGAELTDNTSDNSEDKAEASNEEAKDEEAGKAVVSYIGNGVWRDAKGKCWSRNERKDVDILSTRSYDKGEYEERDDLKFMVKYGEMKLSLV